MKLTLLEKKKKNIPDLLSSGGQRSFIAAAKDTEKKRPIRLQFTQNTEYFKPSLEFAPGHAAFA